MGLVGALQFGVVMEYDGKIDTWTYNSVGGFKLHWNFFNSERELELPDNIPSGFTAAEELTVTLDEGIVTFIKNGNKIHGLNLTDPGLHNSSPFAKYPHLPTRPGNGMRIAFAVHASGSSEVTFL